MEQQHQAFPEAVSLYTNLQALSVGGDNATSFTTGVSPTNLTLTTDPNLHQQQLIALAAASAHNAQLALLLLQQQQHPSSMQHNLIPTHLQALALAPSLHGTPGYPSAVIAPGLFPLQAPIFPEPLAQPVMTVQDRPAVTPVYNGVNPDYPGLRVVHNNPPIFCVDNFLTDFECDFLIHFASDSFGPAPVVGKGSGEVSPSRTSSTCYLAREDLPDYLRKVSALTGKPVEHCELPQVGRYLPSQQYLQHFDAFDLSNEDGRRFAANGGQRTITVLVYLNDVARGGATRFPALNLDVQPRRGMALVFFPATVDGFLDKMALHAALPAIDTKYVSQVWIRQSNYSGQPSKRLAQTLGLPFATPLAGLAPSPVPLGQTPAIMLSQQPQVQIHNTQSIQQHQQDAAQAQAQALQAQLQAQQAHAQLEALRQAQQAQPTRSQLMASSFPTHF